MSGHSKWNTIKHKKGATDAKRGKIFTLHARMVALAARSGGDPAMNPALRTAIDRAKADNVPNDNIDRAIKKGTGEDKDGAQIEEITYEAFGPEGSSFLIDVITDNKNRSLTNIRTLLTKNGGNMGAAGTVAWKFDKKAYLLVDAAGKNPDDVELELIDAGADDLEKVDDKFELTVSLEKWGEVKKKVEAAGYKIEKDEAVWVPKDPLPVTDPELAKKLVHLMELIEEDDDVNKVSSNVDFDESVLSALR
ncbi:MAG: YebC/PmpR family DNA-binding transcriptional regulator [Patescibacteria group bacterium]